MISNLQYLSSASAKDSLSRNLDNLKNAESNFCSYKNSVGFRFFGMLPFFKRKHNVMKDNLFCSYNEFRNAILVNLNMLEDSDYFGSIKRKLCIGIDKSQSCISNHALRLDVLGCTTISGKLKLKVSILSYDVCSSLLEQYYCNVDHLLTNKQNEVLELTDLMIDIWGRKLPEDVVSSLKAVIRVFDLSKVNYESLLKSYKETRDNLRNLEARIEDIELKVDVLCKDSKCVNKLCEESFIRGDKDAFKELCKRLGIGIIDDRLKAKSADSKSQMVDLLLAREQVESKENDLLLLNSHLEKVINSVPAGFPTLEIG